MPDYPQSTPQKSKLPCSPRIRGIFFRSLIREFSANGLLVFSILLGIVVFTQLIRFLAESVSGLLAVDGVLVMLGFSAMNYFPVLLSISLFLSVLITLTRCYRDSEMVVWFSSGIGLTRWIRPVLGYAVPVTLLIAFMSLVLSPWALSKADEYKRTLDSRDEVSHATPGTFRESRQAERVFFLEDMRTNSKRIGNTFVRSLQHGREEILVAREGYQETAENGDRFLVLLNGERYEGVPGRADYRISYFDRYAVRIEPVELGKALPNIKAHSTLYLLQHPAPLHTSELHWRIGLPLSALILALLAIPLSHVDPRAGRSLNLITAIVLYMFYNNMISVTNSWVAQQKVNPLLGLWGLHLGMLLVLFILFHHRSSIMPWWRLRR